MAEKTKLKVGDKVRVRYWDELVAMGYEEIEDKFIGNYLLTPCNFMDGMRELSGSHGIITREDHWDGRCLYSIKLDGKWVEEEWLFDDAVLEKE